MSVVLPVRDGAATLRAALDSTLSSRGVAFEVVVLDHASADGSGAIARATGDARVRVIDASGFPDLPAVLNEATRQARAPLIARMDADDEMHPDRLAADVSLLRTSNLDAVASRAELLPMLSTGRSSDGLRAYVAWQNACLTAAEHAREIWIEQPLCQPATTFARATLERIGGYRAGPFPEDYELFLRLLSTGARIEKRPEVHHRWREHERTATRFSRDALAAVKARTLVTTFSLAQRDVVIGGAGKEGGRIARALAACGVRPHAFVDVDPKKVGRTRHGAPTHAIEELPLLRARGAFLIAAVGTSGARGAVRAQIAEAGFREGTDAVVVA